MPENQKGVPAAGNSSSRVKLGAVIVAVAALAAYLVTQTDLFGRRPTPQHPFQYFKLTNNTGRPIKTAKLEGNRRCTSQSSYETTTGTWSPALGGNGDYLASFASSWPHTNALQLTITFSDSLQPATASMAWALPNSGTECYQDSAAACTISLSGGSVSFSTNFPTTGGDSACP